jgi:hypothetical protein
MLAACRLVLQGEVLAGAATYPADNGLVDEHITVPDFQIVTAIRIGADPCLVMNRCPLTAKIRQGHQVSSVTLLTFRKLSLLHESHLPTKIL